MKCDAREQLPIFTAEADQLALLARSKSVGAGSVRRRQRSRLQLPAAGVSAAETPRRPRRLLSGPAAGAPAPVERAPQRSTSAARRWSEFFAEQRIGWQLAAEKGMTFGDIDDIVDRVYLRLQHHQPQPSLLHGNLWPGNCAMTAHGPILFDPASYWGDRECDLAMLPLCPELPPQIYDGYQSVWPLGPDLSSASRCISCTTAQPQQPVRWPASGGGATRGGGAVAARGVITFRGAARRPFMVQAAPAGCNRRITNQAITAITIGRIYSGKYCRKMVWCGSVMRASSCWRVCLAALSLLQDHLVFQPFADELDLARHACAGSLQRQPDEDQ